MCKSDINVSCCNTTHYFSTPLNDNHNDYTCCPNQIKRTEYTNLISLLEENAYFQEVFRNEANVSIKSALAFYIEATKQVPATVENDELLTKIKQIWKKYVDPQESYKETTWLLNNLITLMYSTVLAYKFNSSREKIIERQIKNLDNTKKLQGLRLENNQPAIIGGIHQSYIPDWFAKHCLSVKPE